MKRPRSALDDLPDEIQHSELLFLVDRMRIAERRNNVCSMGDLPDDVLIRILSLLASSRQLYWCSLVSKRWARLARLVSHFRLESSGEHEQQGLLSWFGSSSSSNLRSLSLTGFSKQPRSCLDWLPVIGKTLHSLTISVSVDGFWSSILACQQLRCLHINDGVELGGPLTTKAAAPILPALVYCFIRTRLDVATTTQLLELCPSLVYFRLTQLLVESAGTHLLKSHSLDCLVIRASRVRGRSVTKFSLALDMPKLRWMFVNAVPRVELSPSTCNVEWVQLHGQVRIIQGLVMSKLNRLTVTNTFRGNAHVELILEPFVLRTSSISGIKQLDLFMDSADFEPRSVNLAQLLEPFHGLEALYIARLTIKSLSLAGWSSRHAPLRVHIDTSYSNKRVPCWDSDEIEFVQELVVSSSCVTQLEVTGIVCIEEPPEFRPQVPPAIVELGTAFPGRVKVHPIRFGMPPHCGVVWRCMKPKLDSEAPYTAIHHRCAGFDENTEACA
ncbi:uncharacterized protein LOC112348607 [Selaginella moellendorffii]|uniref:uncharacterized protein LOC112348607 n=1 Tax=Selaginella moellendorffii TaxID=88036 RepID=UPI000D1C4534|nr:uncharacterized protein LOC112348607 [Selaginella moellendorffii]|eukprot:XP_024537216.1 uncharacterized protein LOC112348607 [Selaginella moellendorffii]